MAQYYYEKYNIDYYWDEISANAIASKIMDSNISIETSVSGDSVTVGSGWYNYDFIDGYSAVIESTTGGYNDYILQVSGNEPAPENVHAGDIYYREREYDYTLSRAGFWKWQVYEKSGYVDTFETYQYTIKLRVIGEITLEEYTIYQHERKGSYVSTIVAEDGTYPDDGISGSYWYVKTAKPIVTLSLIGNKSFNEGQTLSFQLSANIDGTSTITYSTTGLPEGASLDGSTGEFSWSTDYYDEGTYEVTFSTSANGSTDSETIIITVNHVDIEPYIDAIDSKNVDENVNLNFVVGVVNPDNLDIALTATGIPTGASFDFSGTTGTFSWTPDYSQAGTYTVVFEAEANGYYDTEQVEIVVNNVAPSLYYIGNKIVDENVNINFAVSADAPDGAPLIYDITGLPTGATFDSNTGIFNWTPTYQQSGAYEITFIADIEGTQDSKTITITVNEIHQAPINRTPIQNHETNDRRPYFEFTLPSNYTSDTKKYHARLRISSTIAMDNLEFLLESQDDQTDWEYYDGSQWTVLPLDGVPADSKVRVNLPRVLGFSFWYWDCASWEIDYGYGENSSYWKFNILISTEKVYVLYIAGITYYAISLSAIETSNGEIGSIDFSVINQDGLAYQNINYRDTIILAINDNLENQEQFRGIAKVKKPSGSILQISAITGDGILSERRVKENYPAQDIGLTQKQVIDTYCSPLTSNNINTNTGIIAPVPAMDKTPLKVFEELRRQYGIYYFIDANWDANSYLPEEIGGYKVQVRRGD